MADLSKEWDSAKPLESDWEKAAPIPQNKADRGKTYKIGAEGLPDAIRSVVSETGPMANFAVGFKSFIDDAAMRLKQLTGQELSKEQVMEVLANRTLRDESTAAALGNIAGGVAATGVPATGAITGGTALASKVLPGIVASTLASGAVGGATAAATEPVLEGESTAGKAGMGALGGAAGNLAASAAARVVQPIIQSPAVQKLVSNGVIPTPGQAMGPNSLINKIEQRLANADPTGVISNVHNRPIIEANEALLNKANPTGVHVTAGFDGIKTVKNNIDSAYDNLFGKIANKITYDTQFDNAIKAIPSKDGINLSEAQEREFAKAIRDKVIDRLENGASSSAVRAAHNSISALESRYFGRQMSSDDRAMFNAYRAAKEELRDLISREVDPSFAASMKELGKKYTIVKAMLDRAENSTGSREGILSPVDLFRASRQSSMEMKDFARAANDVLATTTPNSGTVQNAMLPFLLAGGVGGVNESIGGPGWLTMALASPFLLTRPGARYAIGDLIPGQAAAANAIRKTAPYASVLGAGIASKE